MDENVDLDAVVFNAAAQTHQGGSKTGIESSTGSQDVHANKKEHHEAEQSAIDLEHEVSIRRAGVLMAPPPHSDWVVFAGYLAVHALLPLSLLFWVPYKGMRIVRFQRLLPSRAYGGHRFFAESCFLLFAHALLVLMAFSADEHEQICFSFVWPSLLFIDLWRTVYTLLP